MGGVVMKGLWGIVGGVKIMGGVLIIYLGCSGRGKDSVVCSGRGKDNGGCIDNLFGV